MTPSPSKSEPVKDEMPPPPDHAFKYCDLVPKGERCDWPTPCHHVDGKTFRACRWPESSHQQAQRDEEE